MMNPMHFILAANEGRVRNWFLRVGTSDTDTSPSVVTNLAAACAQQSDVVDAPMYWDAGHGANEDPERFIAWAQEVTGYTV